ncbi:MAG: biotin--[acetyl-CoA-carboxylase] ligase [Endomicrobium sp.]|uniref:biotin--[acetyl-CoA-carboxylase] ligase n=1 Tax=Candidatus Endomicrobiellum cubanum TaxID=3242325 RepID=UPI002819B5E1|nr:biotin--[acetyl-CoA-carboxylase] ligase [Endomicrobium sp.]
MTKILKILHSNNYISGNEIGTMLSISRAAVHKKIKNLKQIGYNIKSCAKGYKLIKDKIFFNEYEIESRLNKNLSVCKIIKYYKELPSTQTTVKMLAQKGFDEGTVVIAEKQTTGYGRIKKVWNSNNGGLWFSVLLKPLLHPEESAKLALLLSIALKKTFDFYNVDSKIKWPNDILINNKKIAGIIIEMSAEQDIVNWIVAGIGINVNNELPKDLKKISISLKEIINKEIDRTEFICKFFTNFEKLYTSFKKEDFKQFLKEYNDNLLYKNKCVTVDTGYNTITGINLGIDENGMLILNTKNELKKIMSGTLREYKK